MVETGTIDTLDSLPPMPAEERSFRSEENINHSSHMIKKKGKERYSRTCLLPFLLTSRKLATVSLGLKVVALNFLKVARVVLKVF